MTDLLLKDIVYQRIKESIINGIFPMGSKLSEIVIEEKLNANRAPVRDALKRLEAEKLVERIPKKGTFVFSLDYEKLDKLLTFRYFIECNALALSYNINKNSLIQELGTIMDKMSIVISQNNIFGYLETDAMFHRLLVNRCNNPYFVRSYELIVPFMDTVRNHLGSNCDHVNRSHEQHMQIYKSLCDDKLKQAIDILRTHILPKYGAYWAILGSIDKQSGKKENSQDNVSDLDIIENIMPKYIS
ncbi:MAG TPA: GntR family transcriptional regulator [Succinivibrionaceae bacterium]|nr:GntR family transcriptional regulator [Succinivibrionaceae bacterium]